MTMRVFMLCALAHVLIARPALAAVEPIIETFDGDGDYTSVDGSIVGFDNPGWRTVGDGDLLDGGFAMQNVGPIVFGEESDELSRTVVGLGSFVERIEIDSLFLGELCDFPCADPSPLGSQSEVSLRRILDVGGEGFNGLIFSLSELPSTPQDVWDVHILFTGTDEAVRAEVERGTHVAIELEFDEVTSEVTLMYDHNMDDELPGTAFGPFVYGGTRSLTSETILSLGANAGGEANGVIDHWSIRPSSSVTGDFDHSGELDAADIDALSFHVRQGGGAAEFDLNADALVNDVDRQVWVHDLKQTYFGDADLNGTFDSADLVQVLAAGEYEDDIALNSTWLTGDWDGDGDFTSGDLVTALADGGYETAATAAAVPEPSGALLMLLGIAAMTMCKARTPSVWD